VKPLQIGIPPCSFLEVVPWTVPDTPGGPGVWAFSTLEGSRVDRGVAYRITSPKQDEHIISLGRIIGDRWVHSFFAPNDVIAIHDTNVNVGEITSTTTEYNMPRTHISLAVICYNYCLMQVLYIISACISTSVFAFEGRGLLRLKGCRRS